MHIGKKISFFIIYVHIFTAVSCSRSSADASIQNQLLRLVENPSLSAESRFSVINQIAGNYSAEQNSEALILFLTEYAEKHPQDPFNAYWLLMTANEYLNENSEPAAEYYFDKIIQNYDDLLIQNTSIHILCLKNLIQISTSPENRIYYFSKLISQFPDQINLAELYARQAAEYEKLGEWDQAMKSYALFLEQPDAASIQITGIPDAYATARKMIDFNNSPKDWTFESLDAAVNAVKAAIDSRNYRRLDSYKSKVNFFTMSWKQEATAINSQTNFSLNDYGAGNRIRYNKTIDESSTPREAYLRTTGWSRYVSVWYFYFNKINFPADPEIHGRWEWSGIYLGEKL